MVLSRLVLVAGFLAAATLCFYVPFKAVVNFKGQRPTAYVGYAPIWSPPDRETVCSETLETSNPLYCHVEVDKEKALFGIAGTVLVFGALFALTAISWKKSTSQ